MTQTDLLEESAKLRHDARETSRLAAMRARPKSGTIRARVLEAIVASGFRGLTDDELAEELSLSGNTVRPRRVELVEGGWVAPGTRQAVSFYGNAAIAWVGTEKARA